MELLEKSKEGNALSPDEICDRVLGTRSGYIKGLGYGPKPKGKGINLIGVNHACISVKFLCAFIAQLHDSHSYSLILR